MTPDQRRDLALAAIVGGCIVFTGFLGFYTWVLKEQVQYLFWLAIAAHAQILVGLTGLGALVFRRPTLKIGKEGVELSDHNQD